MASLATAKQTGEFELTQAQIDTLKDRGQLSDAEIHEVLGESVDSIFALQFER
jgi:hypothetical protein